LRFVCDPGHRRLQALGTKLGIDPMKLPQMINGKVVPTKAVISGLAKELHSNVSLLTKLAAEIVDSITLSSNGTADKPGSHELFERQQQLILTNCLNYPSINVVICERFKFADLFYSLTVVAERDKLPDEITFRFAHVPYVPPQGNKRKSPSMRLSAVWISKSTTSSTTKADFQLTFAPVGIWA
jgi:hypothetical protein